MPGAFDDVEIIYDVDPKDPTNQIVILENKNKNKSIAANVRISAPKAIEVMRLTRAAIALFPHEFKVTIEAGARQFIGRRRFDYIASASPKVVEPIALTFVPQGAVYVEDEPQPPPSSDVPNYLVFYEVDIPPKNPNDRLDTGQVLVFAINLNHQFRLQAFIESTNTTNEWWTPNLGIFECRLSHTYPGKGLRRGWTVKDGKFVPEFAPFM